MERVALSAADPRWRLRAGLLAAFGGHLGLVLLFLGAPKRALREAGPAAAVSLMFAPARQAEQPAVDLGGRTLAMEGVVTVVALTAPPGAGLRGEPVPAVRRVVRPVAVAGSVAVGAAALPRVAEREIPAPASAAVAAGEAAHWLGPWEARVRQAVQDAVVYPASARMLRREGRVQVQFDYDKGRVARAAVVRSSLVDALDRAAVAAVMRAAMPAAPPGLGPAARTLVVWVDFHLAAQD